MTAPRQTLSVQPAAATLGAPAVPRGCEHERVDPHSPAVPRGCKRERVDPHSPAVPRGYERERVDPLSPAVRTIAVVGGSGAGKTWFVRRLCQLFGDTACHLSLDDFYRDRSHLPLGRRARLNFDIPDAIDWSDAAEVLRHCRAGRATALPCYDFATYSRRPARRHWSPRPLVLVDGLWLLRPAEMRSLFDLKLYLDTPADLRRQRRVARDTAERGYTAEAVHERLQAMVLPMHARYVEPQRSRADLVLSQPFDPAGITALAAALWPLVRGLDLPVATNPATLRQELLSHLVEYEYAR